MIEGNYEGAGGFCAMTNEFQKHVTSSEGWKWQDEPRLYANGIVVHK